MTPKISVIIPIYNIEDLLERCVESVRNQTYENLEILLVDDGSTDGTGALCDRLGERDERIRVFHKPNGGSSSARNLGIVHATGEYLAFVDSDDYIDPDMYRLMVEALEPGKKQIVQISRDEVNEDGSRRPDVCAPPEKKTTVPAEEFFRTLLMHEGDCSFCTKLVPADMLEGRGFPEGELNEDFWLLIQLLCSIDSITILPEQTYHVYYRIGSNTRKKDPNDFSRVFEDIVRNADFADWLVRQHFPKMTTESLRFGAYQRLDYLLHIPVSRMTNADPFYKDVKKWCRRHLVQMMKNPLLHKKQKIYLALLTVAPKTVRSAHRKIMAMRDKEKTE